MTLASRTLVAILLFALVARGAAWRLTGLERFAAATAHHEHADIARNLASGRGFSFNFFGDIKKDPLPTSQQAPLVPSLLAGAYLMLGIETSAALGAMLALQIAVSSWTCVLLARFAAGAAGRRDVGVLAGLLAALYPPLVLAPLHVQALVWNLFWLALMLAGAQDLRAGRLRLGAISLAAGGIGGLLTDPILAAPLGLLLSLLAAERFASSGRLGLKLPVAIGLAVLVGLAPWLARNVAVHGRFAFVKNSFWYVFWQGNTLLSAGTDKLPFDEANLALPASSVADAAAALQEARGRCRSVNDHLSVAELHELEALPTESARMDWFGRRIRAELAAAPSHYLAMCGKRWSAWWGFDPTNPKSLLPSYRAAYLSLAALAALGLFLVSWHGLLPALLVAGGLTAVHVLVITSARFRIPLEMLMLIPAAATLARTSGAFALARRFRPAPFPRPEPLETAEVRPAAA